MNIYSDNEDYNVNFDFYISENKHHNVNFDLKFDSFYNFIESLKESKKYYHDYCNSENIKDFDNEYIDNINILKGELLKYFILLTKDNVEEYVIVDDTIKEIYNCVIKYPVLYISCSSIWNQNQNISTFNINYLTKEKIDILMKDYKTITSAINRNAEIKLKNFDNYSVKYESIYERELDEILRNLPYICLSNISSKKLLNCCNDNNINLIDLDNDKEYPEID